MEGSYQRVSQGMREEDSIKLPASFDDIVTFWNTYNPTTSTLHEENLPHKICVKSLFAQDVKTLAQMFCDSIENSHIKIETRHIPYTIDNEDCRRINQTIRKKRKGFEGCSCWPLSLILAREEPTYLVYFYNAKYSSHKSFCDRKINLNKQYKNIKSYAQRVWYLIQRKEEYIPFNENIYQLIHQKAFPKDSKNKTTSHKRINEIIAQVINEVSK